jgi:hypothetical protein
MLLSEIIDKALMDEVFANELRSAASVAIRAFEQDISAQEWDDFIELYFADDANSLSGLRVSGEQMGAFANRDPATTTSNPFGIARAITTTAVCTLTMTTTTSRICPIAIEPEETLLRKAALPAQKKSGSKKKAASRKRKR